MINYIIQVLLFQTLFLAMYDFFLSKETFFSKNRGYLLTAPILSFVLPLIKIPTFQKAVPEEISILLPEIVLSPQRVIEQTRIYQSIDSLNILFVSGLSIFLMIFLIKLYKLIRLILTNRIEDRGAYKLIIIPRTKKAFSFLNYIFLGEEVSPIEREKVIEHELIHSQQKHTYDLLFFEVLKVVMWFNPLTYVYQRRIADVHEYISDATVVKTSPKETYINKLINEFFDVENISFINQFSKRSLLRKRILMMTKERSKQVKQVKYLLLIPLLVSMVFYTSCTRSDNDLKLEYENQKLKDSIQLLQRRDSVQIEMIDYLRKKNNSKKAFKDYSITEEGSESIPFTIIDKVPTFPGCSEGNKKCFNENLQKHFIKNFDSDLPNEIGLKPGKKRLIMLFKIDKEGNVTDIKAKAPHEKLKEESIRIIKMLPKMIPGEQDGKPVGVKYTLPMRIDVE